MATKVTIIGDNKQEQTKKPIEFVKFLNDSLIYAEKNEFYEQCSIIRDVKKTIES